jgi:hypothetical protein
MNSGKIATTLEDDNLSDKGGYDATTLRVDADASAVINGGTIENICDFTSAIENYGTVEVNDAKITAIHTALYNGGTMTFNGGSVSCGMNGSTRHTIYTVGGKVTVNGGTFINTATDQNATGASVINGNVEVNGGTFTGRVENYSETPVIKGGTFTVKPNANFIPAGYKIVEKADGTYYVDYVRTGKVNNAYTSADSIWGEWGGNAKESFVIKVYSGNTFLGSSSLNNVDGIIDGDVTVTWGLYLDTEAHQDKYWTQVWEEAPTMTLQPTHAALEVDGVEVGRAAIQLNGPDGLWAIDSAIVDDDTQTIVKYVQKGATVEAPAGCKIVKLK